MLSGKLYRKIYQHCNISAMHYLVAYPIIWLLYRYWKVLSDFIRQFFWKFANMAITKTWKKELHVRIVA